MPYTEWEYNVLQYTTISSTALSLTGSVAMGITILSDRPYLKTASRGEIILFFMAIISTIGSFSTMQSIQTFDKPILCQVQASVFQFAINALPLFNLMHSLNFWYILSGKSLPDITFILTLWLSIALPIILTFISYRLNQFGPTDVICWITSDFQIYRYAFYYGPLLVVNVISLYFMVAGILKVISYQDASVVTSPYHGEHSNSKNLVKFKSGYKITNKRHIASAFKASLYGLLFVVIIISMVTNRLLVYFNPATQLPFYSIFLRTSFAPAQGFLNAFCYFLFRAVDFNELWKDHVVNLEADAVKDNANRMSNLFGKELELQLTLPRKDSKGQGGEGKKEKGNNGINGKRNSFLGIESARNSLQFF